MRHSQSDRNLLFAVIALQLDHVSRDQLVDGLGSWVVSKNKSLGNIFVEWGVIDVETKEAIEKLVDKRVSKDSHVRQHSLASVTKLPCGLVEDLRLLGDEELNATLAGIDEVQVDIPTTAFVGGLSDGRFKILRMHDKGGLGVVYLAHDEELNRAVALKRIQEQFAGFEESRARFQLESEITGGLEHPGIVPVYGRGKLADGAPYYAMRFIRGESLKQLIDDFYRSTDSKKEGNKNVQFRKLLGHFVDVCDAVGYAHARGVIHRDIKPQNIMVGKYGETLVVDWGVAKTLEESNREEAITEGQLVPTSGSTETRQGQVFGTPAFMAPEQARGDLSKVGIKSDIYGLGATLYYILTGRPPYEGEQNAVLKRVIQAEAITPARRVNHSIPKALQAIAMKAMNVDPNLRYSSSEDMRADLDRWLADEPNSAFKENFLKRAARKTGIYKRPLFSGILLFLFVMDSLLAAACLAFLNLQYMPAEGTATKWNVVFFASVFFLAFVGIVIPVASQVGSLAGASVAIFVKIFRRIRPLSNEVSIVDYMGRGASLSGFLLVPFLIAGFMVYAQLFYDEEENLFLAHREHVSFLYNELAWLQATGSSDARDPESAVSNALKAIEFSKDEPADYLDTLAAAHAASGHFEEALIVLTRAFDQLRGFDVFGRKSEFENKLKLYENGRPYYTEEKELLEAYTSLAFYQAVGLREHRDVEMALANAERACQIAKRQDVDSLAALAASHATLENFQSACEIMSEAIKLAKIQGGYDQDGLRRTLSQYQSGEVEELAAALSRQFSNGESTQLSFPWVSMWPTYKKQEDLGE